SVKRQVLARGDLDHTPGFQRPADGARAEPPVPLLGGGRRQSLPAALSESANCATPRRLTSAARLQQELISGLKAAGWAHDQPVEAAFRCVPRHLFLPGHALEEVHCDQAIVTKRIDGFRVNSSSQPAIMAVMLEQLGVQPGQRALEIGALTGY